MVLPSTFPPAPDAPIRQIELEDQVLGNFKVGKYFDQLPVVENNKEANPSEQPKVRQGNI